MKTILTAAAAVALAAAISAPAMAQPASEQAAVKQSRGQCAFSQALAQAKAHGEEQRMAETKSKIDLLIENALASSRAAKLTQAQVYPAKASPDS